MMTVQMDKQHQFLFALRIRMNAVAILVLLFSLANANPFEAFYRGEPSPIGYGTVFKTIKVQSAQLAESNLLANEDSECLRRALCAMGTARDFTEWPRLSLGKGLEHLVDVLQDIQHEVQAVDEHAKANYPKIHQAVASYQVGLTAKDPVLCDTLFACLTSSMDLLADIKVCAFFLYKYEKPDTKTNFRTSPNPVTLKIPN